MSTKRESLLSVLRKHLDDMTDWQCSYDIAEQILPDLGRKRISDRLIDDLEDAMDELVVAREADSATTGLGEKGYRGAQAYWKGKSFLVRLTKFESENRILIPGHRFVPFCNGDVHPADAKLMYNGEEVPMKQAQ